MDRNRFPLPIDPFLPEAIKSLQEHPCLVLQAAPGTGKTTRLPPALLRASFIRAGSQVAVLEPRRLAAKLSARRVAQEMGEPPDQCELMRVAGLLHDIGRVGMPDAVNDKKTALSADAGGDGNGSASRMNLMLHNLKQIL